VYLETIAKHIVGWETFKYHKTLREGVCSNRQSTVKWGEGVWPNRHITFIVARKA